MKVYVLFVTTGDGDEGRTGSVWGIFSTPEKAEAVGKRVVALRMDAHPNGFSWEYSVEDYPIDE